ncbi:DEAD/DEAH box helicase family protein [Pseudomonas sp. MF6768]|uniref:DEAD/DEAH box helicase family protein n=1 Tax=Pseudomonas sp. MF6768 TaxID=2797532 RepID=UPI0018E73796|nr:DEAD/DEAH box helicase family protein [Pseudomonas sp. MF6768]MBJ2240621.1 DEAD/DEAH box helicase family protein [Pseudomonas sp. MF6768]
MSSESKTVIIENNREALTTALELREYASTTRLMSIDGNVLNAVSVAYKTASGLHSANDGQIAKSIYSMSKIAIALMIVKADSSDKAFDAAAFEIARDVFVSGKTEEKAQALAEATGRTQEACVSAINSKLEFLTARMNSKTNPLTDTGVLPVSMEAIRDEFIKDGGKVLVCAGTGEGKSSKINQPVIQHYLDTGRKVLVISHRRSINKTLANLPGIVSYDECNDPSDLQNAKGLKIVVNSLNALKFKRFIQSVDLVVIDEASQVISHVLGGEVKNRQSVWETLNFVVKNTPNVIMSDADIDARCAEMIGTGYKLFKKPASHAGITVHTGDINHVRALAIKSACKVNTLIACDAVKEAHALAKSISKKGGPEALVITADNAFWPEQAAFVANPNATAHQVVIYSPVITSALSITSGHFKAHFGVFQGQVVPSDAIQMLRRDRTAKSFTVGIKQPMYSKSEAVDVSYKCKPVCLDDLLSSITFRDGERDKESLVRSALSSLQFQFLEYTHRRDEAWLRDNIQSSLPASLLARGFMVEVLDHDDDLSLAGYKSDSLAKKAVKRQIAKGVSQAVSADESTAQRVRDYGSESEQEYLEACRARAIEVMGVTTFNMDDAMVWGLGEGESKVRLYRKLHNHGGALSGLCQAAPSDQDATVDEISARVMAILKPAMIVMTYSDAWTENRSVELFDTLNAIRTDVLKAGIRLSAAKTNQAKKADITKIFAQFGLSVKRHETTNKNHFYTIRPKSLTQMTRYI